MDGHTDDSDHPLQPRIAAVIGDRPVLAYTTDRKGMRRFTRALYGMLLDVPAVGAR